MSNRIEHPPPPETVGLVSYVSTLCMFLLCLWQSWVMTSTTFDTWASVSSCTRKRVDICTSVNSSTRVDDTVLRPAGAQRFPSLLHSAAAQESRPVLRSSGALGLTPMLQLTSPQELHHCFRQRVHKNQHQGFSQEENMKQSISMLLSSSTKHNSWHQGCNLVLQLPSPQVQSTFTRSSTH